VHFSLGSFTVDVNSVFLWKLVSTKAREVFLKNSSTLIACFAWRQIWVYFGLMTVLVTVTFPWHRGGQEKCSIYWWKLYWRTSEAELPF
jgi:hypothetical protein